MMIRIILALIVVAATGIGGYSLASHEEKGQGKRVTLSD